MANTFTQLYVHLVFAVKARQHLIPKTHKDQVYKYMTGVIQNRKHKLIAINGMPDHVHIFVGLHPTQSISDLVEETKTRHHKVYQKTTLDEIRFCLAKRLRCIYPFSFPN